jgi:hypothetical protein
MGFEKKYFSHHQNFFPKFLISKVIDACGGGYSMHMLEKTYLFSYVSSENFFG